LFFAFIVMSFMGDIRQPAAIKYLNWRMLLIPPWADPVIGEGARET